MTNQQMEMLDRLFDEACEVPEADRRAWLAAHCADPEVCAELESLLPHATKTGALTSALNAGAEAGKHDPMATGHKIGRYRIVGELGHGGMGAVYEALRDDDQFRQTVAIKVLRMSARSGAERRRFLQERQILAELDHPNIARLLDGGSAADGSPYIVMERIEGEPLVAFATSHKLSIRQRVELFREVINAVQYAHQKLIVHRDLKPGNILVTGSGSAKLLDFGIAKLLDPESSAEALTVTGLHLMTPDYASPEQVQGKQVTAASDVYSLGAVLYELLTGVRPHGLTRYDPAEIAERICVSDVAPPSSVGGAALREDLDNIVLKAMQKVPERRYNSAEQFSEDLHRYLGGMPVLARPDTGGYRIRKFVGRHWVGLGATALIVIALVAASAVSWYQARLTESARQVAETQRQTAERERSLAEAETQVAKTEKDRSERRLAQMLELANRSLYDVHSAIEKLPGATDARRQIVATTLQFLENLSRDTVQDDRLLLALSTAYAKVADVQGYPLRPNLGDTAGALASYQKAIDLADLLLTRQPGNTEYILKKLEAETNRAQLLGRVSQPERATSRLSGLLPMAQELVRICPGESKCILAGTHMYAALADILRSTETPAALEYSQQQTKTLERALRSSPANTSLESELASAYSQEASLRNRLGRTREAADQYGRAIALRESLLQRNPTDALMRRSLMISYGNLGGNLGSPFYPNLGDVAGARGSYGKALAIARELAAADANDALAQYDLANAMLFYASLDLPQSEWPGSLAMLRDSERILQRLVAADPQSVAKLSGLAEALEYEGRRLEGLGDFDPALNAFQQSLGVAEKALAVVPSNYSLISQALASQEAMAELLARRGDGTAAIAAARQGVARAEHVTAPESDRDRFIAVAYNSLARVHAALGNRAESCDAAGRAAAGLRRLQESQSRIAGRVESELAENLLPECTPTSTSR